MTVVEERKGFDAMGHPVPTYRKQAAYAHVREMAPEATAEQAWSLVERVAGRLEHDDPYGAMREATDAPLPRHISSAQGRYDPMDGLRLDPTGGYRLVAVLLCAGEKP